MKRVNYLIVAIAAMFLFGACKNMNYKKTKSGLLYKIFSSGSKDSTIKTGAIVKFNYVLKFNDSVMMDSRGKMPGFVRVVALDHPSYDFQEILGKMKKGDSAVTVQLADSLLKRPSQMLPPNAKKGDRLVFNFHIVEVFPSDSLAKKDYDAEMERDKPRQMKEQQDQMAKMEKEQEKFDADQIAQQMKDAEEAEKSGEAAKEAKDMEAYFAKKNIKPLKVGKGSYIVIHQQGTGPQAENGKYVNVKYVGKFLETDSVFQASAVAFHLGKQPMILGWSQAMLSLKQGAKATIYIPGYLAYGKGGGPSGKPFTPMIFDVDVLEVSDNPIQQPQQMQPQGSN